MIDMERIVEIDQLIEETGRRLAVARTKMEVMGEMIVMLREGMALKRVGLTIAKDSFNEGTDCYSAIVRLLRDLEAPELANTIENRVLRLLRLSEEIDWQKEEPDAKQIMDLFLGMDLLEEFFQHELDKRKPDGYPYGVRS